MKIYKYLPFALTALMMGACASEDPANNGGGTEKASTQYLAVNLQNVGVTSTRAGNYDYGTEKESKIDNVRFYFFHSNGNPYVLASGKNYIDKTVTPSEGSSENIEKITDAVLVIEGTTAAAPASIIAVVNPKTLTNSTTKPLTPTGDTPIDINYIKSADDKKFWKGAGEEATDFVMSNSVYLTSGTETCATQVAGFVATTAEAAKQNPVNIYVERVAAKVLADVDQTKWTKGDGTNWGTEEYGQKVGELAAEGNAAVYAVIKGWGVTSENGVSQIEKNILPSWTSAELGIDPWTSADYHRSFWTLSTAFSSGAEGNQPINKKYSEINTTLGKPIYTLPNTSQTLVSDVNNNTLTKFIVAAQLRYQDKEGQWKDAEICEYKGVEYITTASLKEFIAQENSEYYFKSTADGKTTYTKLSPDDLTFTSAAPAGTSTDLKNYEVVAELATGHTNNLYKKTGTGNTDADFTSVTAADLNKLLAKYPAQIYNGGNTYYYTPIKHLGAAGKIGEYGIVRNHQYVINLQTIKGFGTPVYDPDEVIIPSVPSNNKSYIAAKINVLSWRLVKQDVNLDTTPKAE